MTVSKDITRRLYRLATEGANDTDTIIWSGPNQQNRWLLRYADYDMSLELANPDRHSAELYGLQVSTTRDQANPHGHLVGLPTLADQVVQRLGYLEEPLAVWELEEREHTAQLRSSPPLREDDDEVRYWEVMIQETPRVECVTTSLHIARYRWQPGMIERDVVAYPVTFKLLGRMAESLTMG
jgi:hypothetical protein